MKLYDLIVLSASRALDLQKKDGSMPPGHNGPYFDPETPVRNTSHWCITFLKAFEIANDNRFLIAADNCGKFLLSNEARPMESVFYCRKNPKKDFSNGLVGQAWAIEALAELYNQTRENKYLELAIKVFLLHPLNRKYAAWTFKNVDGSERGFDKTFNHQLWFAAAGSMLAPFNQTIKEQVECFMSNLNGHLRTYFDGCIKHSGWFLCKTTVDAAFCLARTTNNIIRQKKYLKLKSIGYHGFNLYGFAILKKAYPDHPFWQSKKFIRTLNYAKNTKFKKLISKSKYGFPYNPPGLEIAFAFETFNITSETTIAEWIKWQMALCYDFDDHMMSKGNTKDKITAAARFYEACRLNNYPVD